MPVRVGHEAFPRAAGGFDPIAGYRLSEPVGYWNALGLLASFGLLLAFGWPPGREQLLSGFPLQRHPSRSRSAATSRSAAAPGWPGRGPPRRAPTRSSPPAAGADRGVIAPWRGCLRWCSLLDQARSPRVAATRLPPPRGRTCAGGGRRGDRAFCGGRGRDPRRARTSCTVALHVRSGSEWRRAGRRVGAIVVAVVLVLGGPRGSHARSQRGTRAERAT